MRIYWPHDARISRAMERIRQAFLKYAPQGTEFFDAVRTGVHDDVIHCVNWIGQNPREHTKRDEICMGVPTLPLTEKYLVFAHIGNPHYRDLDSHYQGLLAGAMLVVTYDKRILGYEGSNIYETPWGFEPDVFHYAPLHKRYKILCTGYMADAEGIDACWDACRRLRKRLCHVGGRLPEVPPMVWNERYEGIKDDKMRALYNASEYVSGMRREGGFELPVIEGYACGAQPIVFDQPTMRKYYSDFAIFVPNIPRNELTERLIRVLFEKRNIQPRPEILERFRWSTIMARMWRRILEVAQ